MSVNPMVSVVVVNWNGANFLPQCLNAIYAQTIKNIEVIVVDNGSSDDSANNLEHHWDGIKVLHLGHNYGFAKANNIGAREASGDWLALVNNDTLLSSDWLQAMLEAANHAPQYASFASRLEQSKRMGFLDSCGDEYNISGLAWHRNYNQPVDQCGKEVSEVFSACGASALYRRSDFLQVGGFDEDYVSFFEDVDLGFRLQIFGKGSLFVPKACGTHVGSASYGKESPQAVYYTQRNLVWTYFKNMPGWLFWKYLPWHILANKIMTLYYIGKGLGGVVLKAKIDAIRGLSNVLSKRKHVQSNLEVDLIKLDKSFNHSLTAPYRLGERGDRLFRLLAFRR